MYGDDVGTNTEKYYRVEQAPTLFRFRSWGQEGEDDGQFKYPCSIAVARNGTIYVIDTHNHRVQLFHPDGTFILKWGCEGDNDGELSFPYGISIGIDDGMCNSVTKSMMMVPELASFPPGVLPICVAYLGVEHIYVADTGNHRIQAFGLDVLEDGSDNVRFLLKWGSVGSGDGQFNYPYGCGVGNDAESGASVIYVADTENHRIQVFDRNNGTFIRKWGSFGKGDGQFNRPTSLSVGRDLSGTGSQMIYIADQYNNRVVCYHGDGRFAREFAGSTAMSRPHGMIIDDDNGVVYVVACGGSCVRQFLKDDTLVKKWGSHGSGDGKLNWPMGIDMGANGILYVADVSNHRIVVMNV